MFKSELHVHTSPVSRCAKVDAVSTAQHFIDEGYDTIVITNHLSPVLIKKNLPCDPDDWKAVVDYYLSDYYAAKEASKGKMNVLLGAEIRMHENNNDYLVYGVDEQFYYDIGNFFDKKIKDIAPLVQEAGGLLFQAHPFRNSITVTDPQILDGIEVYNFSAGHDSRNDIACMWAKKFGLIGICGQDYHIPSYLIGAGMLTDTEIKDNKQLVDILKSASYQLTDGNQILTY